MRYQDRGGAHLTPARQHMIRKQDRLFPLLSDTFAPLQSAGLGGLGISWGANCFALEDFELDRIGIPASELRPYYDDAAREVGLSGRTDDSLAPLIANLDRSLIQPPLPLDSNAETILRRYDRSRAWYNSRGFYLGQSLLAMLSKPHHDHVGNPIPSPREHRFSGLGPFHGCAGSGWGETTRVHLRNLFGAHREGTQGRGPHRRLRHRFPSSACRLSL